MARILVVDDDEDVRNVIERTLAPVGHELLLADNGVAAMHAMDTDPADLVITDIYMEVMDGVEFVIRLREINSDVPVIAISGGGFEPAGDVLERIRGLGVRTTIEKPFDPKELRHLVRKALNEPDSPSPTGEGTDERDP